MNDKNSLSHTTWRCKYHIIIVPKYRRMVIYNKLRLDIGKILRMLIERKPGCKLLEAEACPDHTPMLIEITPKYNSFKGSTDKLSSTSKKEREK